MEIFGWKLLKKIVLSNLNLYILISFSTSSILASQKPALSGLALFISFLASNSLLTLLYFRNKAYENY